jgi:hypothetical protein
MYSVRYYPWFHITTVGLGTYYPWMRGHTCIGNYHLSVLWLKFCAVCTGTLYTVISLQQFQTNVPQLLCRVYISKIISYWFHILFFSWHEIQIQIYIGFSKTRNPEMLVFLFQVCRNGILLGYECGRTANFRPASYLFARILHTAHPLRVTRVYYCAASDTKGYYCAASDTKGIWWNFYLEKEGKVTGSCCGTKCFPV